MDYPIPELLPLRFVPNERHLAALDYAKRQIEAGDTYICCLISEAYGSIGEGAYRSEAEELRYWVSAQLSGRYYDAHEVVSEELPWSCQDFSYEDWVLAGRPIEDESFYQKTAQARLTWIHLMVQALRKAMLEDSLMIAG